MIVYNTTFHIEKEAHTEALHYLKTSYIPRALVGGLLSAPALRRVMQVDEQEGVSYSVQFMVDDVDTLNQWMRSDGSALHQELVSRFGYKVAGFTTLLEEIDWTK